MKVFSKILAAGVLMLLLSGHTAFQKTENIVAFEVDRKKMNLALYWKDEKGDVLRTLENLNKYCDSKKTKLEFAMNGGMFMEDLSPLGLYIENGKTFQKINNRNAKGNFYLKPNGVFFVTGDGKPHVCSTEEFGAFQNISFATQSGPMLLINGKIHDAFTKGSSNLNLRNGVGILPNGNALLAMSTMGINFYDFALYFKELGCVNTLYLDGFVSRIWQNGTQTPAMPQEFGVLIGVTKK